MKNSSLQKGWNALLYVFLMGVYLNCQTPFAQNTNQQQKITGTISDANGVVPGVTVTVKGKAVAAISDAMGSYTITAAANDELLFSFIGYKTVAVAIAGRTNINVQLEGDATTLQEVTVNAGYYTVKDKERTGSIAKITAKDIEKQPVNNPLAAMAGRMSGVNITQNTGLPGGGFDIQIRGLNSIRTEGNAPLYIVNGVPYASQSLGDSTIASTAILGLTNPLNNLNPADIESIEVLKDADATAIYGSRGANGVVLITTKKGSAGETKFNVNAYTTVGQVARELKMMNTEQYLSMRAEAFANDGYTSYPDNAYDINGTWDQNRYTNWRKKLIGGTALIHSVQAAVSGGNASTQYLLSGTYRKEGTVFPGDANYGKGALHSNITHQSGDKRFNLNVTADYTSDKNTLPGTDLTALAYSLAPNAPALYDSEGNLNWENGTFTNPLAFLKGTYLTTTQNLLANAMLSYKVAQGLELKTSLGYNDTRLLQKYTSPMAMNNPFDTTPSEAALYLSSGNGKSWIIEPQISYSKRWGKAKVNVLAGATFQSQTTEQLAQTGSGFTSDALINSLAAASTVSILNHTVTEYNYTAAFARINLNWEGKYLVNLTGRRDGSSRFGPANRFATFGAVGAVWVFSKETLFRNKAPFLSFGKLRTSYGTTGNDQIGDYQYLNTYSISPYLYDGIIGLLPSRLYNASFGWETNIKWEVALELGFFQDRIFLSTAYFCNRSSSQLVGIPLPGTTGFPTIQANLDATVQNTGVEVELKTTNYNKKNFLWTTTLNLTMPRNKLVAFPNLAGSTYANQLVIGESLFIHKVFTRTGIDPTTGAYTFRDYNGDGQITYDSDRQGIIDTAPKYYGGLGNQITVKNWSFDCLFQYVKQTGKNYLYGASLAGGFANQPAELVNHYPQNGTNAIGQQYTVGDNSDVVDAFYNLVESDAAFSDASYIRLKTASITYSLPTTWSKTLTAKIYVQGQNLMTFTKYRGADPENQSLVSLPPLRQFTIGFQLGF